MDKDMDHRNTQLEQRTAALRQEFIAGLVERLQTLEQQWQDQPTANLEPVYRELHNMAGAAGTFGLSDLHQQFKALEQQVQSCQNASRPVGDDEQADFLQALQELRFRLQYSL